jgi:TonB family protein
VTETIETDRFGRYALAGLAAGEYEVRFTRDGFRPRVVRLDLGGGASLAGDVILQVGSVTETITLKLAPDETPVQPPDVEAQLLQRLADRADDAQAHLALAELYYRQERFPESETAMLSAARLFASSQAAPAGPPQTGAGGDIDPPRKVRDVLPVYPSAARAAGVTGTVTLEATISEDGTVQNAHVVRSVPMLDDAALGAVRQWLYRPTRLNGVPVAVTMTATVRFAQD